MLWPCFDHGPCKVVISSPDPPNIISKQKKKSANDPHHFHKRKSAIVPGLWFVNHFPPVRPSPLPARKANWGLDVAWPWVLGCPVQVQYKSNKSQECNSVEFSVEWIRYPSHIPGSPWNCFEIVQLMAPKCSKHPSLDRSMDVFQIGKICRATTPHENYKKRLHLPNSQTLILNITYFWYLGMAQNMSKYINNEATIVSIHVSRFFSRGTFNYICSDPCHPPTAIAS